MSKKDIRDSLVAGIILLAVYPFVLVILALVLMVYAVFSIMIKLKIYKEPIWAGKPNYW